MINCACRRIQAREARGEARGCALPRRLPGGFWTGLGLRVAAKLPQVNNLIRVADYDYVTMTRTNPVGSVLLQGMSANC